MIHKINKDHPLIRREKEEIRDDMTVFLNQILDVVSVDIEVNVALSYAALEYKKGNKNIDYISFFIENNCKK